MDLHLLLPLVLVPAILVGYAFKKIGLPVVVGQILVGVALGPMGFALIGGNAESRSHEAFHQLAEIGLCVLLFKVGLETRLREFVDVWRRALGVALVGMVLPLALGIGIGLLLQWSLTASLFLGAALTATSIGVTAAVIDELGLQHSAEARTIMGAAVADDVMGLLLLSALTAVSAESPGSLGAAISVNLLQAIVFLGVAIAIGPLLVRVFDALTDWLRSEAVLVVLAFSYLLVMARLADDFGLAGIIGSYAAGLAFSERDEKLLERSFEPIIEILTPVFFILVGSSIILDGESLNPRFMGTAALVLVIAVVGKMAAPFFIPRFGLNRFVVGSGLVPRGEVGLVFAQAGIASAALSQAQYSLLTLVIVASTLLGPLLFRVSAKRMHGSREQ